MTDLIAPLPVKPALAQVAPIEETRLIDGELMTYQVYRRKLDVEVAGRIGVGLDDLADSNTWDLWDCGTSVKEGAREVLESDGTADDEFLDEIFGDEDEMEYGEGDEDF